MPHHNKKSKMKLSSALTMATFNDVDVDSLDYREAQRQCKSLALPARGNTASLRQRLRDHFSSLTSKPVASYMPRVCFTLPLPDEKSVTVTPSGSPTSSGGMATTPRKVKNGGSSPTATTDQAKNGVHEDATVLELDVKGLLIGTAKEEAEEKGKAAEAKNLTVDDVVASVAVPADGATPNVKVCGTVAGLGSEIDPKENRSVPDVNEATNEKLAPEDDDVGGIFGCAMNEKLALEDDDAGGIFVCAAPANIEHPNFPSPDRNAEARWWSDPQAQAERRAKLIKEGYLKDEALHAAKATPTTRHKLFTIEVDRPLQRQTSTGYFTVIDLEQGSLVVYKNLPDQTVTVEFISTDGNIIVQAEVPEADKAHKQMWGNGGIQPCVVWELFNTAGNIVQNRRYFFWFKNIGEVSILLSHMFPGHLKLATEEFFDAKGRFCEGVYTKPQNRLKNTEDDMDVDDDHIKTRSKFIPEDEAIDKYGNDPYEESQPLF